MALGLFHTVLTSSGEVGIYIELPATVMMNGSPDFSKYFRPFAMSALVSWKEAAACPINGIQ